jgi:hypothetical protein
MWSLHVCICRDREREMQLQGGGETASSRPDPGMDPDMIRGGIVDWAVGDKFQKIFIDVSMWRAYVIPRPPPLFSLLCSPHLCSLPCSSLPAHLYSFLLSPPLSPSLFFSVHLPLPFCSLSLFCADPCVGTEFLPRYPH